MLYAFHVLLITCVLSRSNVLFLITDRSTINHKYGVRRGTQKQVESASTLGQFRLITLLRVVILNLAHGLQWRALAFSPCM